MSVSASSPDSGDDRAWYANSGEVKLDGDWGHKSPDGATYEVAGTSFAAPRLSYLEARYLLTGGQVSCDNYAPPLGYTNIDSGNPRWLNLLLGNAVTSYCQNFSNQAQV